MIKKTAVLSLSLMIIFGATSCSPSTTVNETKQEKVQNDSPSLSPEQKTEKNTVDTLNAVYKLSVSDDFNEVTKDLDNLKSSETEDFRKAFEDNAEFFNQVEKKITIGDEIIESYKQFFPKVEDDVLKKILLLQTMGKFAAGDTLKDGDTFTLYPGAITDQDGETNFPGKSVYKKDVQGGIIDFAGLGSDFIISDNGNHLEVKDVSNPEFDENPGILEVDLQNAATTLETYIVSAGSTKKDIIVKDDKIVGSVNKRTGEEYVLKHDPKVTLKVTGNTSEYKITGTVEGTNLEQVYDNVNGGIQKLTGKAQKEGVDYEKELFSKYKSSIKGTNSAEEASDSLKTDFAGKKVTFEPIEKDGTTYFKVSDAKSKFASEGELLYLFK